MGHPYEYMTDAIYQIEALTHRYDGRVVLSIEQLAINRGAITGLTGPNGSGKTTLLKLLALIDAPSQGAVCFQGQACANARQAVAYLPQTPYLLKRTVFQNLLYGLKLRGRTNNVTYRVDEALSLVGLPLEVFGNRYPGQLSGGEAQRVALAARLIVNPEVLLLDEPTANVDEQSGLRIKEAVQQAREKWQTTVVVASHDLPWLYENSDQVLQVYNGRVWPVGDRSVISGPWQLATAGCWEKQLSDGQVIQVKNQPPTADATAIISLTGLVAVAPSGKTIGAGGVTGTIARMILEKKTGRVVVTLAAAEALLTIRVPAETLSAAKLYPGATATVTYDAATVQWL